jgi:hypothetical protein
VPGQTTLSPRAAIAFGLLAAACGLPAILGGLGLIPFHPTEGTPAWVAVAAGMMFVLAGAALIVGYAIGGAAPDGNFAPGTPIAVQVVQYFLGLGIVGLMTAVFGWVAFGPGPRHFSSVAFLPFVTLHPHTSELSGRIVFGLADVLMMAMLGGLGFTGARRIRQAQVDRSQQSDR